MEESAALTEAKASSQPEWAQLTVTRLIGSRGGRAQQTAADETVGRTGTGRSGHRVGAEGKFADAARNQENPVQRAAARGPESRIKKITR